MKFFKHNIIAVIFVALFFAPAVSLGSDRAQEDLIGRLLKGQEMIFARNYGEAVRIFDGLKKDYPDSPAGDFGVMATYEIRMLEREDFHLANEFLTVSKEGLAKAAKTVMRRGATTWDLFMAGSILGLDGFFKARKEKWWDAYTEGTKSRQIFRRVKEMDPSFVDADFGLGMYIYWRSVFARDLFFLRMFPDRRAEGIAIVERVARDGRYAKDIARVNLAVMYMEEKRFEEARAILDDYISNYPDNVILRMMQGRTFIALKRYDSAVNQFREVLKRDGVLIKPHYFLGAALVLKGNPRNFGEAQQELAIFLGKQGGKYWPACAHYWLGRLKEIQGLPDEAKAQYDEAKRLYPKIEEAIAKIRALGAGV